MYLYYGDAAEEKNTCISGKSGDLFVRRWSSLIAVIDCCKCGSKSGIGVKIL